MTVVRGRPGPGGLASEGLPVLRGKVLRGGSAGELLLSDGLGRKGLCYVLSWWLLLWVWLWLVLLLEREVSFFLLLLLIITVLLSLMLLLLL